MSVLLEKVSLFASLGSSDLEAQRIAREFAQMILDDPQLILDFIEAGIIPAALRKFDDGEDASSRLVYATLLRTLTTQKGFPADSRIQESIGRARRELREIGVLFVILRVLRLDEKHHQDLWMILSDTMSAVIDRVSMPFNELAVPWLVMQLEQCRSPWQVFCCASMLRSCLGVKGKSTPANSILEHAFSTACVPVLVEKLRLRCGQDGNQPIASILKVMTTVPRMAYDALRLNAVPAILANMASPQPMPSRFIDPSGEWCDELDYHRALVQILRNLVGPKHHFCTTTEYLRVEGAVALMRANCTQLLFSRLWCKTTLKLLSKLAAILDNTASFQYVHFLSQTDCEQFLHEYAQALVAKLADATPSPLQIDAIQHVDRNESNPFEHAKYVTTEFSLVRAITALSDLASGQKAILDCNGSVTAVVKYLKSVLQSQVKCDPSTSLPHPRMGNGLCSVSKHGGSLLLNALATLLNLVKMRRGTKGAVAASAFHAIPPVFFATVILDEKEPDEQDPRLPQISYLHAVAAEIMARLSSITKGQRQATAVAPTILNALCTNSVEPPSSIVHLINVLGNIVSTQDGLSNLAYCNAAAALQRVRELITRRKQSTPQEIQKQIESAGKLHTLHTLIQSQETRVSEFSARVSSSCAGAAARCLVWPEDNGQVEFRASLKPGICSFAVASAEQGSSLPWLRDLSIGALSCGAFVGMLMHRLRMDSGVSFGETILQYCVARKFNQEFKIRMIRKAFGSTFADGCVSIQKWIECHDYTRAAARMIQKELEKQFKVNHAQQQWFGRLTLEKVAAQLKEHINLPPGWDATVIARSAVSIFSPPLALLGIGDRNSEFVVLCQNSERRFSTPVLTGSSERTEPFNRNNPESSTLFAKPAIPEVQSDPVERQPLSAPSAAAIPPGWVELLHQASGLPYYVNTVTNASTWERPVAQSHPSPAQPSQPILAGHQLRPHRTYSSSPHHKNDYLPAVNSSSDSTQHTWAPPTQKYALPPNVPTPQKSTLPPNSPLLQAMPKTTVQEIEFKEALHVIQQDANQNFKLVAPASRHNETDVVSDEDESQNILDRVWDKLFQAAQNAQEEKFDFKN